MIDRTSSLSWFVVMTIDRSDSARTRHNPTAIDH